MPLPNVRFLAALAMGAAAVPALAAQQRLVVQGLAGAEAWKTDPGSRLLARNDGRAALLGQLHLWGAASLGRGVVAFAMFQVEGGAATDEDEVELGYEQLVVRWTASRAAVLEAGKFPSPVGAFAPRRLADRNPLIGTPDLYPVAYPWGAQISGAIGPVDYRAAIVDLPVSNERYVPKGGARVRPALGAGITPLIGLRVGASFTTGSYLSSEVDTLLPSGTEWQDYGQSVLALDGSFSRGYFELRAEAAFSSYDVPGHSDAVTGTAVYLEGKYTWSPRLFTAIRAEINDYAFIRPRVGLWTGTATRFSDVEAGIGYRLSARTLVKGSLRMDFWDVPPARKASLPNGHAVAFQVSHGFDVTSWLTKVR